MNNCNSTSSPVTQRGASNHVQCASTCITHSSLFMQADTNSTHAPILRRLSTAPDAPLCSCAVSIQSPTRPAALQYAYVHRHRAEESVACLSRHAWYQTTPPQQLASPCHPEPDPASTPSSSAAVCALMGCPLKVTWSFPSSWHFGARLAGTSSPPTPAKACHAGQPALTAPWRGQGKGFGASAGGCSTENGCWAGRAF